MSVCETCNMLFKSEAEKLIHTDNWPSHIVLNVNEEVIP